MNTAKIECSWQKSVITPALYLITLDIGIEHALSAIDATAQSLAVMDDFGNLVAVGGWQ